MRKIIFVLMAVLMISKGFAFAETVHLKDGTTVEAKVLQKDSYYTILEINGRPMRYFNDQIVDIKEDAPAAAAPQAPIVKITSLSGISPTKLELITRFLQVNGTRASIDKRIEEAIANAPENEKARVKSVFVAEEMLNRIIPVYDQYYTEDEIRQLVEFYSSPTGQKSIEINTALVRDVVRATLSYFQEKLKQ